MRQALRRFRELFLSATIFAVTGCSVLWSFIPHSAAVSPNGQQGRCGPYYLWYQIGPDSYTYSGDYVDLCEITFDISEVLNDFDFVYFTGKWAHLDKNRDGISDLYFYFPPIPTPTQSQPQPPKLLKWKPEHGCVRINLRDCWGMAFNENCGSAMISIQPRPGFRKGSVKIQ